jgi:hypothetical protein
MSSKNIIYDQTVSKVKTIILQRYGDDGQEALDLGEAKIRYGHEYGDNVGRFRKTMIFNIITKNYKFLFNYFYVYNEKSIRIFHLFFLVTKLDKNDAE